MKKAWIENDMIRDICTGNPLDLYHPEIAKHYDTDVPDDACVGDGWVDGQVVKPEIVIPEPVAPEPNYPKVSPVEFKLLFTSQERVAIREARSSDAVIDDFYDIVEDSRLTHVDLGLKSTQDALDYMVGKGLVSDERKAEILTGKVV